MSEIFVYILMVAQKTLDIKLYDSWAWQEVIFLMEKSSDLELS